MLVFVIRRLAWAAVLVAVITLITFVIFLAIPNSRVSTTQGVVQPGLRTQWHLGHHSLAGQYVRVLDHVFVHGDLGSSLHQSLTVRQIISSALPVTLSLVVGGTILWLLLAFPIGLLSAMRPRSLLDRGLMLFVLVGVSAHPVWLGLMLSYFFGFKWHVLPIAGYCDFRYDPSKLCGGPRYWASHMILPWITFAFLFTALYARMIRAGVLEALEEDYVRTARAKGAGTWRVLRRHVLRNALMPVIGMLGMDVGVAFGGAIFIETVFDLPGMGQAFYSALGTNDQPVIMGVTLVVGVAVALANLVADLIYCFVDPRVRLRSGGWARTPSFRWRRTRARSEATAQAG